MRNPRQAVHGSAGRCAGHVRLQYHHVGPGPESISQLGGASGRQLRGDNRSLSSQSRREGPVAGAHFEYVGAKVRLDQFEDPVGVVGRFVEGVERLGEFDIRLRKRGPISMRPARPAGSRRPHRRRLGQHRRLVLEQGGDAVFAKGQQLVELGSRQ